MKPYLTPRLGLKSSLPLFSQVTSVCHYFLSVSLTGI